MTTVRLTTRPCAMQPWKSSVAGPLSNLAMEDFQPRRSLAKEDVVRLILDGTVVRVRLDRKATSISLLVVLGIRRDGQRCCWRCATWAARARLRGAVCSMI